jgi:hypothetical protein
MQHRVPLLMAGVCCTAAQNAQVGKTPQHGEGIDMGPQWARGPMSATACTLFMCLRGMRHGLRKRPLTECWHREQL